MSLKRKTHRWIVKSRDYNGTGRFKKPYFCHSFLYPCLTWECHALWLWAWLYDLTDPTEWTRRDCVTVTVRGLLRFYLCHKFYNTANGWETHEAEPCAPNTPARVSLDKLTDNKNSQTCEWAQPRSSVTWLTPEGSRWVSNTIVTCMLLLLLVVIVIKKLICTQKPAHKYL